MAPLLRVAGAADLDQARAAEARRSADFAACQAVFGEGIWPLELIDAEPLLDEGRTVLHYLGPHRLDAAGLVAIFRDRCGLDIVLEPVGPDLTDDELDAEPALADEPADHGCGSCGSEQRRLRVVRLRRRLCGQGPGRQPTQAPTGTGLNSVNAILFPETGIKSPPKSDCIGRAACTTHPKTTENGTMRRFRNPRYAPEGLERKLNPSGFALPVTAEYAPADPSTAPTETDPTPTVAAETTSVVALAGDANQSAGGVSFDPPPTVPGPLDPTDPNPGTGEPPWGGPPIPSGPSEPDCVA